MEPHVIRVAGFDANLSPDLFRRYSRQYLECHRAYKPVAGYSPIPYFLLCRAIELALKAHHLKTQSRDTVKRAYSHNLIKLYHDLAPALQTLTAQEHSILEAASAKYGVPNKGFEYVSLEDVLTGQRSFPNLIELESLAARIVET